MTAGKHRQRLVALGTTIRNARRERGLSLADLAASASIEREQLQAIELGRYDPAFDVLIDLARGLDTKLSVLVTRSESLLAFAQGAAFGQRLRELRTERGISQDRLAQLTGLHRTAISLLERGGREPRLPTILRLAQGMGVSPDELLIDLGNAKET